MLKIDALKPRAGARRRRRRVGRGLGSGSGVYAGRGRKGQKARAGSGARPGVGGGPAPPSPPPPLPPRGGAAGSVMTGGPPRMRPAEVSVRALTRFPAGSEVTVATLVEAGLVDHGPVKVLGGGRLAHALVVKAQAFSKGAKQAIAAAGGKAEIVR